jgi:hypothetical protein
LVTAATTSRQWLNAKIGNSIPSRSQISVRIPLVPLLRGRERRLRNQTLDRQGTADDASGR